MSDDFNGADQPNSRFDDDDEVTTENKVESKKAVSTNPKPKKVKSVKTTMKKPVAKKPAKKSAKKSSKKTDRKPRTKKEGLRMFQIRTLKVLNGTEDISQSDISKKAGVGLGFISKAIGAADADIRASADKTNGFDSLLTLKFVRITSQEGRSFKYSITAAGKSALDKYLASTGKTLRPKNKNK